MLYDEGDPRFQTVAMSASSSNYSPAPQNRGYNLRSAQTNTLNNYVQSGSGDFSDDDIFGNAVDGSIDSAFSSHALSSFLERDLVNSGIIDEGFSSLELDFDGDSAQHQHTRHQHPSSFPNLESVSELHSPLTVNSRRFSAPRQVSPYSPVRHLSLTDGLGHAVPVSVSTHQNSSSIVLTKQTSSPPFDSILRYAPARAGSEQVVGLRQVVTSRPTLVGINRATSAPSQRLGYTPGELPTQVLGGSQFSRASLPDQVRPTAFNGTSAYFTDAQIPAVRNATVKSIRNSSRNLMVVSRGNGFAALNNANADYLVQSGRVSAANHFGMMTQGNEVEVTDGQSREFVQQISQSCRFNGEAEDSRQHPNRVGLANLHVQQQPYVNGDQLSNGSDDFSAQSNADAAHNGEYFVQNRCESLKHAKKAPARRRKRARFSSTTKKRPSQNAGSNCKTATDGNQLSGVNHSFQSRPSMKVVSKWQQAQPVDSLVCTDSIKLDTHSSKSVQESSDGLNDGKSTAAVTAQRRVVACSSRLQHVVESAEEIDSTRAGAYQVHAGWRCVICDRYASEIVGRKNYSVTPERYRLIYYGLPTCKGCQVFFRKTLMELKLKGQPYASLPCPSGGRCSLLAGVGFCVACRFNRCVNSFPSPDALKPQRTREGEVAKMVLEKPVLHKVAPDEKPLDEKPVFAASFGTGSSKRSSQSPRSRSPLEDELSGDRSDSGDLPFDSGMHDTKLEFAEVAASSSLCETEELDTAYLELGECSTLDDSGDSHVVRIIEVASTPSPNNIIVGRMSMTATAASIGYR